MIPSTLLNLRLGRSVWLTCAQCRSARSSNAGIRKRLKIFKLESPDLSNLGQLKEKDFEEIDLLKPRALRKEYEKEYLKIKKCIELKKVEREFFEKRKNPNFLLWAEKEQIRRLHQDEPEKWTPQKLSESFPATPDIIKKILKAQWKIEADAIRKHDQKVVDNWKAFQEGKLDLPSYLSEHLGSFTARDRLTLPAESSDLVTLSEDFNSKGKIPTTQRTEFLDIIRTYKGTTSPAPTAAPDLIPPTPGETFVLGGKRRSRHFTLSAMKSTGRIENPMRSEDPPAPESSTSAKDRRGHVTGTVNPTDYFNVPKHRETFTSSAPADDPPEEIRMKIAIPKEKWKKGAVYKVNNCFYADDGDFLYKI